VDTTLFLLLLSGICWSIVYIDSIRVGFKLKTYTMPIWALGLNIAWEFLHTVLNLRGEYFSVQTVVNGVWFFLDLFILFNYFRFGSQFFPKNIHKKWFYIWSVVVIVISFLLQYLFVVEFGQFKGAGYAAFLQNLLMSVLFITMLVQRGSSNGQTLTIAVCKCIGTIAPTILFGIVGHKIFEGANSFILAIGIIIALFDTTYIWMLAKTIRKEKQKTNVSSRF
jgi:hypothetical protein